MYTIQKKHYGLHVTMGGLYSQEEIKTYILEKEELMAQIDGPFSMLVDLRQAIPPDEQREKMLEASQARMKQHRLLRMALIVSSPVIAIQARQIMINAAIGDRSRIINAAKTQDWETKALDWILYAIEPDGDASAPSADRTGETFKIVKAKE